MSLFKKDFRLLLIITAAIILVAGFVSPPLAWAATINVTTYEDEYGTTPDTCSLREAIQAANTNLAFDGCMAGESERVDEINLPAGTYELSIEGEREDNAATGDLDINGNTAIVGPADGEAAAIIDANGIDRVFHIRTGATVTISDVIISGGEADTYEPGPEADKNDYGGGIYIEQNTNVTIIHTMVSGNIAGFGGGIYNGGATTLLGVTVENNTAVQGGGIYTGEWNSGNMTIKKSDAGIISTISGNIAASDIPSAVAQGGGIHLHHTPLIIQEGTIIMENGYDAATGNAVTQEGGGIYNVGGYLTLDGSSITGNKVTGSGGGLYNTNPAGPTNPRARVTLTNNCHVDNNSGGRMGGGIHNNSGKIEIRYCTVNRNVAKTKHGGGLYNNNGDVLVTIERSTFDGNKAGEALPDGTGHGNGGAIFNAAESYSDAEGTYPRLLIQTSTISNNWAFEDGGGLSNGPVTSGQPAAQIINSTFAFNMAHRSGGGLYVKNGTVTLDSVTVAENIADVPVTGLVDANGRGGGIYLFPGATVHLHNTLIAQNSLETDFSTRLAATGLTRLFQWSDCAETQLTSEGYNYIGISDSSPPSNCLNTEGAVGDQNRLLSSYGDPPLFEFVIEDQLRDWGGPTLPLTLRPLPLPSGGGAIDHGDPDRCQPIDQRGEPRDHPPCDIGALETTGECGNGMVEAILGEECDTGGESATCNADCTSARCGDNKLNTAAGEACDGGGESATCNADCTVAGCGDGVINSAAGETCEDGNADNTDACVNCARARCGDEFIISHEASWAAGIPFEYCDDANSDNTDACLTDCTFALCGDGFVISDSAADAAGIRREVCDDGGSSETCNSNCTISRCGDGIKNPSANEWCDDGGAIDNDGCSSSCTIERGYVCRGSPSVCQTVCGDRIMAGDETCDDGNVANGDGCSDRCQITQQCSDGADNDGDGRIDADDPACHSDGVATHRETYFSSIDSEVNAVWCGNGVIEGSEVCDDGNADNTDACMNCVAARCGDGFVLAGVEACDDGNSVDNDNCRNDCALPTCGDGIVQPGEACDDDNESNLDTCLNTCLLASCGDRFVQGTEECDGTENCGSDCKTIAPQVVLQTEEPEEAEESATPPVEPPPGEVPADTGAADTDADAEADDTTKASGCSLSPTGLTNK